MSIWVAIFDDSFSRVPRANYPAMYADGYRVMAGYVGGGSSDKWVTAAEIRAWLACGHDTGFLPLFEATGREPIEHPSYGTAHAKAARLGARARGVPDHCTISWAMDTNVSVADAHDEIHQYASNWAHADTIASLPYIEEDAGAVLYADAMTCGTGTPAAYAWNNKPTLFTPANAPAHVLWTQEHNGVRQWGAEFDIGHIRTDAPIMWRTPMAADLDQTDAETLWARTTLNGEKDTHGAPLTAIVALGDVHVRTGYLANVFAPAMTAAIAAMGPEALAAALAPSIIAALPTGTLDHDAIVAAVHDGIAGVTLVPPAP